ncbi:ABC transporter ATP-binding protein [Yoonia maritima]|uniref:ABC transporter ATP-binding protein n=1 Tax=Yoonia maritima TaxID=1435347 RepID=UPI000D0F9BBF|nr:ABC transporter ATP-binding protein [Yoonia maritima]
MPQIDITHLTKRFGADAPAVDDVSFTVEDGSFTCILGPSGCGKSTLLRMIAGLERASEGEIAVDGTVVDGPRQGLFTPPETRGVGLVFQSYALWPHMTVEDNIAFGLKVQRMSTQARKARVAEMIETLQIGGLERRYPSQLSGGQQQRVALARTLALAPKVLLLDEPLSNLDAALRLHMRAELARLHREFGTTIVFVTHDQWEAMTLATHIAVVSEGRLQQMGTANDIYDRPAHRFVAEFIGNPQINIFEAGSAMARKLGTDMTVAWRPETVTLADVGLPARVRAVLPTGGSWIVELDLPEHRAPLLMSTNRRPDIAPGQAVTIAPPTELHLFDAGGQRHASDPISHPLEALTQP